MTVYMVEPEMTGCWEQLGMMCWMAEVEMITLKAVKDDDGVNTLKFGETIVASDIKVYRTDWNDLTIHICDSNEYVKIVGYFTSDKCRKFNVTFADGTEFDYTDSDNPVNQVITADSND